MLTLQLRIQIHAAPRVKAPRVALLVIETRTAEKTTEEVSAMCVTLSSPARYMLRSERVSGPEFQFSQIKACRFKTFSRPTESSQECTESSLVEFSRHTRSSVFVSVPSAGCRGQLLPPNTGRNVNETQAAGAAVLTSAQSGCSLCLPPFSHAQGCKVAAFQELRNLGQSLH